ncbi:hypothetical protein C7974DRAFT_396194 [Boeremia exigua]|uniref:uncharacterized protein n=1 Tax=Boeremia exigua TaxID=749465 RepID=UPI001E8CE91A|nr:uncharacterized protein C7974DRAFT_396194 [Boeremia exigua]KAH6625506.1 hypothetical protein C7974DRAFT_396194 [Boeremia exigua]
MSISSSASEKRLRSACDRCRSQKLRCPHSVRFDDDERLCSRPCARCVRAGALCIFSERCKSGRPTKASVNAARQRASQTVDGSILGDGPPTENLEPQFTEEDLAQFELDITMLDAMSQTNTDSRASSTNTDYSSLVSTTRTTPLEYSAMNTEPLLFHHDQENEMGMAMWPSLPETPKSGTVPQRLENLNILSLGSSRVLADGSSFSDKREIVSSQSFHSTYFPKLSELGLKIFFSSRRYQSTVAANQDQTTYTSQVVEDLVNLSGELINLLRQCLPSLVLFSGCLGEISSSIRSRRDSNEQQKDTVTQSSSSIQSSGVLFLLLGCYTQILDFFDAVLRDLARKPPADQNEMLTRTKQSLNASLIKHTIDYFFSQICKDLSACDQAQSGAIQLELVQDKSDCTKPFGLGSWRNIFLSEKPVDKSLLGHAFDEIQQRERALHERTRKLQRLIDNHQ